MTKKRFVFSMAQVGFLLGVLASIKLYVDTRAVGASLIAIPVAVTFAALVASVVTLFQRDELVIGTKDPKDVNWNFKSVLGLLIVVLLAFGSTLARSFGVSALIYVPMLVCGTIRTMLFVRRENSAAKR